jgi:hypothetical protein
MGDVTNHLKNTLWPFLQNVCGELTEMDAAIAAMYEQSEDILQLETGKLLASVIIGARTLIEDFKKLIPADDTRHKAIREWEAKATEAIEDIEEITIAEGETEDDEDDEDGDGEGDDDDGDGDDAPSGDDATKGAA